MRMNRLVPVVLSTALALAAALPAAMVSPAPLAAQHATEGSAGPGHGMMEGRWEAQGSVNAGGSEVEYTSIVGSIVLRDQNEHPTGQMFYTAYHRNGVADLSERPIIFSFNGGPGSSSFWLHMGVMGPKRVAIPDEVHGGGAPYRIVPNEATLLDRADIVMIDPIGTGFSRPLGDTPGSEFWGVSQDAASITQFIQRYLSQNRRWNSPKYLLGESYGTMRSAVLARTLQGANIDLNGIILVSAVLDLQTLIFSPNDDIPFVVNLPGLAVTSWYLDVLPGTRPADRLAFMAEVEEFATTDYLVALTKGNNLTVAERQDIIDRVHQYTGLSRDFIDAADLRISAPEYEAEILRDDGRIVGRLDARFTGPNGDRLLRFPAFDPQSTAISAPYTGAWNTYLRDDLGYDGEREYTPSGNVQPWDWEFGGNVGFGQSGLTNVAPALKSAMERNPNLKVLLINGIYDLATPYFAAVWTMDHMGLSNELRANIERQDFESGHMMYVHEPSLPIWRATIRDFIDRTWGN
jgi:carboxypeptidase C (cathepsin A)